MGGCWDSYTDFLIKWRRGVMFFWLVALIISCIYGFRFLTSTETGSYSPSGSASDDALQAFKHYFPEAFDAGSGVILVHYVGDTSMNQTVVSDGWTLHYIMALNASYAVYQPAGIYLFIDSYWNYAHSPDLAPLANSFLSEDRQWTIIHVFFSSFSEAGDDFIHYVRNTFQTLLPNPDYTVELTSVELLYADTTEESEKDFIRQDSISIPLALVVLSIFLRSLRLMILPILSLLLSVLVSFLLCYPIALALKVASFAPSIMLSIIIAMSIDYSLFLLSRFREEVLQGIDTHTAVRKMLHSSGHVVLISGTTLAVTFLGIVFIPLDFLRSVGFTCPVALLSCMAVNLSLTPALLLEFHNYFRDFSFTVTSLCSIPYGHCKRQCACRWCCWHSSACQGCESCLEACFLDIGERSDHNEDKDDHSHSHTHSSTQNGDTMAAAAGPSSSEMVLSSESAPSSPPTSPRHTHASTNKGKSRLALLLKRRGPQDTFWFKLPAWLTTRWHAWAVFMLILVATLPIAVFVSRMETTSSTSLVFPRNSPALHAYNNLKRVFSPGVAEPYRVLVTGAVGDVLTQDFFLAVDTITRSLIDNTAVFSDRVTSITHLSGVSVNHAEALGYLTPSSPLYNSSVAQLYRVTVASSVNSDQSATFISVQTSFDPEGDEATPWIKNTRYLLGLVASNATFSRFGYHLFGGATFNVDSEDTINALLPVVAAMTLAVLFIFVGFVFKSVTIPLRLLLTLGLSICWVYGLAVLVFQTSFLHAVWPDLKDGSGIFWMEPTMTFSIMVGLGLDYDVLLLARVREYRLRGFSTRAAIIRGVYKTGGIITGAGIIMAIAFGGLMGANALILDQFGFILCMAVLMDTFVVRSLLVPCVIYIADNSNWWPGFVPEAKYDEFHLLQEEEGQMSRRRSSALHANGTGAVSESTGASVITALSVKTSPTASAGGDVELTAIPSAVQTIATPVTAAEVALLPVSSSDQAAAAATQPPSMSADAAEPFLTEAAAAADGVQSDAAVSSQPDVLELDAAGNSPAAVAEESVAEEAEEAVPEEANANEEPAP